MRFQVAKQDLEAALQVVTPSLSSSGTDITSHYVFRRTGTKKDGYGVEVVTCSGRVFSSCPIKGKVADPGQKGTFTIEGKRLKQWLSHVTEAALTFSFDEDEGEVVAKAPKGKQLFQTLQPDKRFTWSKTLEESKLTATVAAERLASALSYSRLFASTDEAKKPDMCLCEVQKGILFSSDKKSVALVKVEGLDESKMRVHTKDVNGVLAFLGTFDGTDVEVLEHERMLILRRGDGAVFGESRFQKPFPGLKAKMGEPDQRTWTLNKADVEQAIGFLVSGASWEDNRLRFVEGEEDNTVVLSMMTTAGKATKLPVECVSMSVADGADDMPDTGFALDHFCLSKVLGSWKGDEIEFGLNVRGDRGYVQFKSSHDEVDYLTILAWLR